MTRHSTPAGRRPPGILAPVLAGVLLSGVGFGGFVWWAATQPLASAAVAPGVVVVEDRRRPIQNLEGGLVHRLAVREGQTVAAGDVLIEIANVEEAARRSQLAARQTTLLAEIARLKAERDGHPAPVFPPALTEAAADPGAATAMALQTELFTVRREAHRQATAIARSALAQAEERIAGLVAQSAARETERDYVAQRLKGLETIEARGFASSVQVNEQRARLARLEADLLDLAANRIAAQEAVAQRREELAAVATDMREEAAARLQRAESELAEVQEARAAAEDVMARTLVTSPVDGRVVGLSIAGAGVVVPSGETMMEIVPLDTALTVEALIDPADIDAVIPGMPVDVRLTAFSLRSTSPLKGRLEQISADRIVEGRTGAAIYKAVVRLEPAAADTSGLDLHPGMGAEVYVLTGEKTLLSYLLDPLIQPLVRALRET